LLATTPERRAGREEEGLGLATTSYNDASTSDDRCSSKNDWKGVVTVGGEESPASSNGTLWGYGGRGLNRSGLGSSRLGGSGNGGFWRSNGCSNSGLGDGSDGGRRLLREGSRRSYEGSAKAECRNSDGTNNT
jgi:hypothetical protein